MNVVVRRHALHQRAFFWRPDAARNNFAVVVNSLWTPSAETRWWGRPFIAGFVAVWAGARVITLRSHPADSQVTVQKRWSNMRRQQNQLSGRIPLPSKRKITPAHHPWVRRRSLASCGSSIHAEDCLGGGTVSVSERKVCGC